MNSTARIALAMALVGLLFAPSAQAQNRSAGGARPPITPEGRMEDIKVLREEFFPQEISYTPEARAEAERRLTQLEVQVATISQPRFELELARIIALADNGHTHYVSNTISRYYNRVPIRLGMFGEDFHVLRAAEADADLLSARLIAIDGHDVESLRSAIRRLWGGVDTWRDRV